MNGFDEAAFIKSAPILQLAIDRAHGAFDLRYVMGELMARRAILWAGEQSAVVTSIKTTPTGKVLNHAWLAAGSLEEIQSMRPVMEAHGAAMGADFHVIEGRRGFERAFPDYRLDTVLLVKEAR